MTRRRLALFAVPAGGMAAVFGVFLAFGVGAACTTMFLVGFMALQLWQAASISMEDDLLDPHVLRGPPDGGGL
jgi:hypothetical protein